LSRLCGLKREIPGPKFISVRGFFFSKKPKNTGAKVETGFTKSDHFFHILHCFSSSLHQYKGQPNNQL
jgi:hypothetical protein